MTKFEYFVNIAQKKKQLQANADSLDRYKDVVFDMLTLRNIILNIIERKSLNIII